MSETGTQGCTLQRIIDNLADPYQGTLITLVNRLYADGGLSDVRLAAAMRQAGIQISHTSINHHRRRVCVCPGR